jgi:hypothetical protein
MLWTRRTKTSLAALLALFGLSGCVERRYTIRSEPPGALVIVNGEEIGTTPVSRAFTFYGDRSIRLVREGYEVLDVVQPVNAPLYDNLVTEFFTETLLPYTLRDERTFNYKLSPVKPTDPNELLGRAEGLRAEGQKLPAPRRGGVLGFFGFD